VSEKALMKVQCSEMKWVGPKVSGTVLKKDRWMALKKAMKRVLLKEMKRVRPKVSVMVLKKDRWMALKKEMKTVHPKARLT
jgi:hypothetical protein